MKFQDKNIETEYNRIKKECPDLENMAHPLINVSDTLKAYFALADYFTDESSGKKETMLVGIRSLDLLCSALGRQVVSFGSKSKYSSPLEICSTLFFGMVKNHSFSDGNKRTALLLLLYQLNLYNYLPSSSVREYETLVVATAANTLPQTYPNIWSKYKDCDDAEVKTIAHFLRKHTKKKDHTYHLKITMMDMDSALKKYNVESHVDNGKIQFTRTIVQKGFFKKEEQASFCMVFGGWTRTIGATTARDLLKALKLYDQFPNYKSFLGGEDALYTLINDFEAPLRRLKDE